MAIFKDLYAVDQVSISDIQPTKVPLPNMPTESQTTGTVVNLQASIYQQYLSVFTIQYLPVVSEVGDESAAGMARQSIEEEQIESEVHTVPLKVLGSCHSGEGQKILEAFEYLNEYNRPVYVQLEKEPDNLHDPNAIATYVKTVDAFHKFGYIAS
ncbi:Hypothetical predicted protein [Paramuricea clavata]|uniref:Uncharacterized protein n=1 Tax=Paramuricea clavata TaxID=317549 RepID=A0A7D9JU15_PARCT|nr:Hypothetical predicted protein [Paramuricea clavata]